MTRNKLILMLTSTIFAAMAWPALAAPAHYSITAQQIAAAVIKMGVQITPDQVTLPTDVVAATPAPLLQVHSLEPLDTDRFIMRLECENREDCLPFIVSIRIDWKATAQLLAISSRLSPLQSAGSRPRPIVIRSGSRAILLLDNEHVHIRIPVICLESGAAGQTIRATDQDHRRNYTAQVVDDGLLKGRL